MRLEILIMQFNPSVMMGSKISFMHLDQSFIRIQVNIKSKYLIIRQNQVKTKIQQKLSIIIIKNLKRQIYISMWGQDQQKVIALGMVVSLQKMILNMLQQKMILNYFVQVRKMNLNLVKLVMILMKSRLITLLKFDCFI